MIALIAPCYPKGEGGRPAYPLMAMLRVHLMQNWFGYSNPTMEEALYETTILCQLSGLNMDADHIRMIVDNNPKIPSRIKALIEKTGESPAPSMVAIARSLEAYGVDFIVIPCNTAHHYYNDVAQAVTVPVVNMLDLVVQHVRLKHPQIRNVGILASTAIIGLKMYDRLFSDHGIKLMAPHTAVQ